jgi:hypothetical protein
MANDDTQRLADLVWLRDSYPSKFLAVRVLSGRVAFRDALGATQPSSLKRLVPILRSYGLSNSEIASATNAAIERGLVTARVNAFAGVDLVTQ